MKVDWDDQRVKAYAPFAAELVKNDNQYMYTIEGAHIV
jgi:hypothetical protein